jgi:hypothetical protein
MKKILTAAVLIATFLIMPSVSSAQKVAIADSELNAISAQYAPVTVTFTDPIAVPGNNHLATTSTNFIDFWNNRVTTDAYFGMTDAYITDALFFRSGSITTQAFDIDPTDPRYPTTQYKIQVTINNLSISSSDMGFGMTLKLGTRADLTTWNGSTQMPDQVLGLNYTGGIAATVNGALSVYARNTTFIP